MRFSTTDGPTVGVLLIATSLVLAACAGSGEVVAAPQVEAPADAAHDSINPAAETGEGGTCARGRSYCDGLVPTMCTEQGVKRGAPCPFGCSAGACVGACVDGMRDCADGRPMVCDGGVWKAGARCDGVCTAGACAANCTQGDRQCASGRVELCIDGSAWDTAQTCPYGCEQGKCVGECVPGAIDCAQDGRTPRVCGADGTFRSGEACATACTAGACSDGCYAGTSQCSGTTRLVCRGGGYEVADRCTFACVDGACAGECVPGARKCQNAEAYTCTASGQWKRERACSFGCSDGQCAGADGGVNDPPAGDSGVPISDGGDAARADTFGDASTPDTLGPSTVELSEGPILSFGSVPVGSSVERTLNVRNAGPGRIVLGSISTATLGLVAPFAFVSGTCTEQLGLVAGETCSLVLRATPSSFGSASGLLSLAYRTDAAHTATATRALSVVGATTGTVVLSGDPVLEFGSVVAGQAATRVLTVTNGSNATVRVLPLDAGRAGLAAPFSVTSETCTPAGFLAPGGGCQISVSFAPASRGVLSDALEFAYEDGSGAVSTVSRALVGAGVAGAKLEYADTMGGALGDVLVGRSVRVTLTVRNVGDVSATLGSQDSAALGLTAPFSRVGGTCVAGVILPQGAQCTLELEAAPVAPGAFQDVMELSYAGGSEAIAPLPVSANGVAPAEVTLSGGSELNFGSVFVGSSELRTVSVTNTSGVSTTLGTISSQALGLTAPFALAGGTCSPGVVLPPSGGCTLSISATPTEEGIQTGSVTISYSGGLAPSVARNLRVTGASPASLSFSDAPTHDFGMVHARDERIRAFVLRNGGSSPATLTDVSTVAYPFEELYTDCFVGTVLAPGATCMFEIGIQYYGAKGALGAFRSSLTVGYTGGTAPNASLELAGTIVDSSVAVGPNHTCISLPATGTKCWGIGSAALGYGDLMTRGASPNTMGANLSPLALGTGAAAVELAAGDQHTCARLASGDVKCWGSGRATGSGDAFARGDNPGEMGDALPTVRLGTNVSVASVVAGFDFTCALTTGGLVKCWGNNTNGVLGLGDTLDRGDSPLHMGDDLPYVALGVGTTAKAIGAGYNHVCVLTAANSVKCWGANDRGQLGSGDLVSRGSSPTDMGDALPPVALGSGTIDELTVGWNHACVRMSGGAVRCWGANDSGQLGLGDTEHRGDGPGEMGSALPYVSLGDSRRAISLAAGSAHTCAILDDGSLKCWGANGRGRLGLGNTLNRGDSPGQMGDALPAVALGSGRRAVHVAATAQRTCVVLDDLRIKCWGANTSGELGLGDTSDRGSSPTHMGDLLPSVSLVY